MERGKAHALGARSFGLPLLQRALSVLERREVWPSADQQPETNLLSHSGLGTLTSGKGGGKRQAEAERKVRFSKLDLTALILTQCLKNQAVPALLEGLLKPRQWNGGQRERKMRLSDNLIKLSAKLRTASAPMDWIAGMQGQLLLIWRPMQVLCPACCRAQERLGGRSIQNKTAAAPMIVGRTNLGLAVR